MLVAHNQNNQRCVAWETEKDEAPFHCPECQGEAIIKKGLVKEHHFAHKPPVNCAYGASESQLHLRAKREIYNALVNNPKCFKCEIERRLEGVRPDISLYIGKTPVAIEVQCDTLDLYDIIRRTKRYNELGIYLLWLVPHSAPETIWREKDFAFVHRIKEWEKFIHGMYFGKLYHWQAGRSVLPYHFKPFEIYVEEKEWHGEYGEVQYGGGYSKTAKTLKTPVPGDSILDIVEDFKASKRASFQTDNYTIPACKLWMEN